MTIAEEIRNTVIENTCKYIKHKMIEKNKVQIEYQISNSLFDDVKCYLEKDGFKVEKYHFYQDTDEFVIQVSC